MRSNFYLEAGACASLGLSGGGERRGGHGEGECMTGELCVCVCVGGGGSLVPLENETLSPLLEFDAVHKLRKSLVNL